MQFTAWKIGRKNDRVTATEPFRGRRKPRGGCWRALRDGASLAWDGRFSRIIRISIDIEFLSNALLRLNDIVLFIDSNLLEIFHGRNLTNDYQEEKDEKCKIVSSSNFSNSSLSIKSPSNRRIVEESGYRGSRGPWKNCRLQILIVVLEK